jgi:hypothetical protein
MRRFRLAFVLFVCVILLFGTVSGVSAARQRKQAAPQRRHTSHNKPVRRSKQKNSAKASLRKSRGTKKKKRTKEKQTKNRSQPRRKRRNRSADEDDATVSVDALSDGRHSRQGDDKPLSARERRKLKFASIDAHFSAVRAAEVAGTCGNGEWQTAYAALHREELAKASRYVAVSETPDVDTDNAATVERGRFLVSIVSEKGLGDRLTAMVTHFYIALLTNRAFQVSAETHKRNQPSFEAAFDYAPPHFVNCTRETDAPSLTDTVRDRFKNPLGPVIFRGDRSYSGNPVLLPDGSVDDAVTQLRKGVAAFSWFSTDVKPAIRKSDFAVWPRLSTSFITASEEARSHLGNIGDEALDLPDSADAHTVFMAGNRGATTFLFDNAKHAPRLRALGLTPENAFGCAMRFLFAPNESIRRRYHAVFKQLAPPPAILSLPDATLTESKASTDRAEMPPLRIGIQVRAGAYKSDDHLPRPSTVPDDVMQSIFSGYFKCAMEAEQAFAKPGQRVIWFLMSDSPQLRQSARKTFGAKVVTESRGSPFPRCDDPGAATEKECDDRTLADSVIAPAADLWAFSMTDVQIITKYSGFGRVGAWLSLKHFDAKTRESRIFEIDFSLKFRGECCATCGTPLSVSAESYENAPGI